MIKIIGCLTVILSSTILGFIYSEKFRKRVNNLNEIERCLCQLKNDIVFAHTSLPEALLSVAIKSKAPVNEVFQQISHLLYENKVNVVFEAFKISFIENKDNLCLEKEDLNIILDFSKTLGEFDIDSQSNMFELTINNLKKQINYADENKRKYMRMYRYLGFSIGAMVAIVLI